MRVHPSATDGGTMEPTLTLYSIRINGHLGPTALSAFAPMVSERQGGPTVLTGQLPDRSALYGVLAEIEALGLDPCARGTTSGPGFVTSDQWKIAPRRPMLG